MKTETIERISNVIAFASFFGLMCLPLGIATESMIDPPAPGERPLVGITLGAFVGLVAGGAYGDWEFRNRKPRG